MKRSMLKLNLVCYRTLLPCGVVAAGFRVCEVHENSGPFTSKIQRMISQVHPRWAALFWQGAPAVAAPTSLRGRQRVRVLQKGFMRRDRG